MKDNFFDEYPLDYLISKKDKKSDFYQEIYNTCVYLLDGHKSTEGELEVSWRSFRTFVFVVVAFTGGKPGWKVGNVFINTFKHSDESPDEFMKWFLSDIIHEAFSTEFDWETLDKTPIDFSSLFDDKKRRVKPIKKKRDKNIEQFFRDYVDQGGGHIQRPTEVDLQLFAKETLHLIEDPKIKDVLKKITFGRLIDWLPENLQKTLITISRLTLRDGKMLIAAKPLLENWKRDYASIGETQVAAAKPKKPKQKRGAQLRTEHSLKRLREIRLDSIENHRSIPKKAAAMNQAGITDKTFREHDPELWARWDDENYR